MKRNKNMKHGKLLFLSLFFVIIFLSTTLAYIAIATETSSEIIKFKYAKPTLSEPD